MTTSATQSTPLQLAPASRLERPDGSARHVWAVRGTPRPWRATIDMTLGEGGAAVYFVAITRPGGSILAPCSSLRQALARVRQVVTA